MKKKSRRNFGERKLSTVMREDKNLEELVFRVFLKHVKANNLYIAFRWSVNRDNANKDIIHVLSSTLCSNRYRSCCDKMSRIGCAFIGAHSVYDIMRMMHSQTNKHKIENNGEFQMTLMSLVNSLIHNCIEHAVKDMGVLEKIGNAVFEEVGKKLFGDDFKDMTEELMNPQQREFMAQMQRVGGDRIPSRREIDELMKMIRERTATEGTNVFVGVPPYNPLVNDYETRGMVHNPWEVIDYCDSDDEWF